MEDLFEDIETHDSTRQPYVVPFGSTLDEIEKQIIFETLSRFGGDKKVAAQVLGIAARTIYRKLEQVHENSEKKQVVIDRKKPSDRKRHDATNFMECTCL